MPYPISAFLSRLDPDSPAVVVGCYTPATLGQLAQGLCRLCFGAPGGALLIAGGERPQAWAEVALRGAPAPVRRVSLPAAPAPGPGFALVGLGPELGFTLVATPTDAGPAGETGRLYDVRWSPDPACVGELVALAAAVLPDELRAAPARLRPPRPDEALSLSGRLLDFAARQHSAISLANRALADRLRSHEDQTRMIVHDMRAPLHTLLISIRAMQRQRFDPDGQRELLDVAGDSATYLLTLTETVLDSARLETSGWSLKRQAVAIHALVSAVCEPLELATRPDQPRLRRALADDLPTVWLDRDLMERVLTNLVTNAIKYTPPSGEILVGARLAHDGHAVELRVSDTGQGIPPEAQAHIFERFYQASEFDRRRGTGLGLYFCRLAVEAHGGSIAVQSAVGQGSTFTILLPITGEP